MDPIMTIDAGKLTSHDIDSSGSAVQAGIGASKGSDPSDSSVHPDATADPQASLPDSLPDSLPEEPPAGPDDDPSGPGDAAGFPIVAIGASAGGLNAIRRLLRCLAPDAGLAYVVIQHLDPVHPSQLANLLSTITAMPVMEAGDGMLIERDHVYVIAPNCRLGVHHRRLLVLERSHTGGLHLPVDYFMGTLADDVGLRAIGVVLSGTGSDGTEGLKAIKAAGGMTFAQDEQSADYAAMPASAVLSGFVDLALPPEQIAANLMRIARHPYLLHTVLESTETLAANEEDLGKIFLLLRSRTGNDFTFYKRDTVLRRIKRRMAVHLLDRLPDYVHYLQSKPAELDGLFSDLLISVTGFFREPESFDVLRERVYPILFDAKQGQKGQQGRTVRIWVPGCATGEEVYSLAMTMFEYLGEQTNRPAIQIFGTDIDAKAISKARLGFYSSTIVESVSPERLQRFFNKTSDGYQVVKEIRALCVFAVQNVLKDPPFSRLDLVSCRNLMIYLGPLLQRQVLETFHYALDPHRFLMLGISESIGSRADLFVLFDRRGKIYEKKSNAIQDRNALMPRLFKRRVDGPSGPALSIPMELGEVVDRVVLLHYGPPGVVVSNDLEILLFRGETGPYFNPCPGSASLNLLKLVRRELLVELRAAIDEVRSSGSEVFKDRVWHRQDGAKSWVGLRVVPINEANQPTRMMVLFEEAPALDRPTAALSDAQPVGPVGAGTTDQAGAAADATPVPVDERIVALERALTVTRDYLQSIISDQEHSNEQLKAANEEVQSANEELQSTVEELETAREELQSTNEELATINNELEARNHDLAEANVDLANLLASINQPFLMLGHDLRVRQFTPPAAALLNLIPGDLGRPILNIKPNLEIPDLARRVKAVIDEVAPQEIDLQDVNGHWYSVRIRPYKSVERRIEGVVIAFVDIDAVKLAEADLRNALEHAQRLDALVRDAEDAILVLGVGGAILAWNPAAERSYGYSEAVALAMPVECLIPPEALDLHFAMIERLRRGEHLKPFKTERLSADGRRLKVLLNATALLDTTGVAYAVATTERLLSEPSG